jgi:hypothetical protein
MREAEILAITEHFFESEFTEDDAVALLGAATERQQHEGRDWVFLRPDARSLVRVDLAIRLPQEGEAIRGEDGELYAAEPFVEEMVLILRGAIQYSRSLLESWFGPGRFESGPINEDGEPSSQVEYDYVGGFSGQVIVRWWSEPLDPRGMGHPDGPDEIRVEEIHLRRHPVGAEPEEEVDAEELVEEVLEDEDGIDDGAANSPGLGADSFDGQEAEQAPNEEGAEDGAGYEHGGPPADFGSYAPYQGLPPEGGPGYDGGPSAQDGAQDVEAPAGDAVDGGYDGYPSGADAPSEHAQDTLSFPEPTETGSAAAISIAEAMDEGAWVADLAWKVLRVDFTVDRAFDVLGLPDGPMGEDGEAFTLTSRDERLETITVIPRGERVAQAVLYPSSARPLLIAVDALTDRFGSEPNEGPGVVWFKLDGTRSRGTVALHGSELQSGVWSVEVVDLQRN